MSEPVQLIDEIVEFRRRYRSAVMASVGEGGAPTASYSPYVSDESGDAFVLISGLARHTRDLLETGVVTLLFLEDEAAAKNIFGRKRLTVSCAATEIPRDDAEWSPKLELLRQRQGKLVDMLGQLPDFRLFRVRPRSGSYVGGFAQAHPLGEAELRTILADDRGTF